MPQSPLPDPVFKEGSVVRDRIGHLLQRPVRLRVRWTDETTNTSGFETLEATLIDLAPLGRDYFFFGVMGPPEKRLSTVIKASAVLQITEILP